MNEELQIVLLNEKAKVPTRAYEWDAGLDLYSTQNIILPPMERIPVKTGISMAIPQGFYGRVAPRSGLAVKKGLDVMAGVVDSSYRNEITVVLINLGKDIVEINEGDKIAQMVIERCYSPNIMVVSELEDTDRGQGGFGSTGN
jgi:dUTP pyrophosphatase